MKEKEYYFAVVREEQEMFSSSHLNAYIFISESIHLEIMHAVTLR